jgi:hypothetical protein
MATALVALVLAELGVLAIAAGLLLSDRAPGAATGLAASPTIVGRLPASVVPSARPASGAGRRHVATRVVIPALGIDLPVVRPPAGSAFPVCDVVLYLPSLAQPGERGATYLYAHARIGMFLPILTASEVNNGSAMIGLLVRVYTSDDRVYRYQVRQVRRHQRSLTDAILANASQLWLQTSEGPSGAYPKVQLIALPLGSDPASAADAHPTARPVRCS